MNPSGNHIHRDLLDDEYDDPTLPPIPPIPPPPPDAPESIPEDFSEDNDDDNDPSDEYGSAEDEGEDDDEDNEEDDGNIDNQYHHYNNDQFYVDEFQKRRDEEAALDAIASLVTPALPPGEYIEEENGHSMPNIEEIKTEAVIQSLKRGNRNPHSGKNRRSIILIAICTIAIALIVGFSVAIVQNNNKRHNNTSSVSAASTETDTTNKNTQPVLTTRDDSRLSNVQEFLYKISNEDILHNVTTPQYKAALWIADQDELYMEIPNDPTNYDVSYLFVQRYIMAVFYYTLNGPNWTSNLSFLSSKDVCDWHIGFNANQPPLGSDKTSWKFGVECNTNGAITHIFITGNGLMGQLPEELGDLLDLKHLSLFRNEISGTFPYRMRHLKQLQFVAIESNLMSGPLPEWINQWINLEYLALGDNEFTGPLPDFTGMNNLKQVALDQNYLTGSVDMFNEAYNIEHLFLNNNLLSSRIHDKTVPQLTNLKVLDLSVNQLTGYFPAHFYKLEQIYLHENNLNDGELPEVTIPDHPLTHLTLYNNSIYGNIPNSIGFLSELIVLDLAENQFTGDLTYTFDNLKNLQKLYLSGNNFNEGPIPSLRECYYLRELALASTNRKNSNDDNENFDWIGTSLPNLVLLDLHDNNLDGTIPSTFGNLQSLKLLFLNSNSLTGDVPEELSYLTGLVSLFLDSNNLSGSLQPVCDADIDNLAFLSADCNELKCDCCKTCCDDYNCNESPTLNRLNVKAIRNQYVFSEDLVFRTSNNSD